MRALLPLFSRESVVYCKYEIIPREGDGMERYRVLLVDDEEDIRVGISQKMDWEGLGFTLVGEAENGQDALELAETLQPDVVLTDIKMPFMDGLELCGILTARLPASKFVVFSGFDDFEYAKQAIQMNVSEYILKPINAAELSAVLKKLKSQLDAERTERRNAELLRQRYEESLPILREQFFSRLLEGRVPRERMLELAERYDVSLSGNCFAAAIVHIDRARERSELEILSVEQLFSENLRPEQIRCRTFLYNDSMALLAALPAPAAVYDLIQAVNRVCALAESYLDQRLTVGVGAPCARLEDLPQSAAGARSALEYRGLVGKGQAIYIGDLEPDAGVRPAFTESDEEELTGAVKLRDEEAVRAVVDRLTDKVRSSGQTMSQCQLFFLELLTCLLRLTRDAGLEVETVFGTGFTGAVQATDFTSPDQMGRWCLERCLRIQTLIRRQRTDTTGRMVEEAKAYINAHYGESELSVEKLCEHLHLSPAYFSTLFKREVGMSFIAYVTVVRMEAAASMLRSTEDKTYLIARRCGYDDPNYFSYVFKRHFGMTPTKYRAGAAGN